MSTALIGYTGFVGTSLRSQTSFDENYNSKNIHEIQDKDFSLVVCAGAPAAKWKANQDPEGDIANLNQLMNHLRHIQTDMFVLISTVDVYKEPIAVDESTHIDTSNLHAYGKHRYFLEEFVREQFSNYRIVRLPGLFGAGLRKNFLFDMIHHNESPWTHHDSIFQFYNMANLWRDLQVVIDSDIQLINFATEPVKVADIALNCFDTEYTFETEKPSVSYDMHTLHADVFGLIGSYMVAKNTIYDEIRVFAATEKDRS